MPDAPPHGPGLADYVKAAFHFRPFGMYVAPNWVALGVAGLLGFVNPGFWLLGLAGEGLYLLALVQNARFRALVDAHHAARRDAPAVAAAEERIAALPPEDRARYARVRAACDTIVSEAGPDEPEEARADRARLLERLLAVLVDLLAARRVLARARAAQDPTVPARLDALRIRLAGVGPGELRDSLADQADVLARRADAADLAEARAAWVDAELGRIEDHVGLLRDQVLLPGDSSRLGADVDRLTERLTAADRWLNEQRAFEDAHADAPSDVPRLRRPGADRAVR